MKKFAMAALAALALLFGGLFTAAPAQAAGAYMVYNLGATGVYNSATMYHSTGVYTIYPGNGGSGAWKVCPRGYDRIKWISDSGASGLKGNGVCAFLTAGYAYQIGTRSPS